MKKLFSLLLAAAMLTAAPAAVRAGAYTLPETAQVSAAGDAVSTPTQPDENETEILKDTDSEENTKKDTDSDKVNTLKGDADNDGELTSADALMTLRISVGLSELDKVIAELVDMDGDGAITSSDALTILHVSLGIDLEKVSVRVKAAQEERERKRLEEEEKKRQEEERRQQEEEEKRRREEELRNKDYSTFKKGIDISRWNGWVDFDAVKAQGIDFVIISAGYGNRNYQKDPNFDSNYNRAKAAGLDVGVYWYSYAQSEYDARCEAWACLNAIQGKQFEYPIYFDIEENWQFWRGKSFCSSLVEGFCSEIKAAGYFAGFYASVAYCKDAIYPETQLKYCYWAADWTGSVHYSNPYGLWQYQVGYLYGCPGTVDKDYAYFDYPEYMKDYHWNGY